MNIIEYVVRLNTSETWHWLLYTLHSLIREAFIGLENIIVSISWTIYDFYCDMYLIITSIIVHFSFIITYKSMQNLSEVYIKMNRLELVSLNLVDAKSDQHTECDRTCGSQRSLLQCSCADLSDRFCRPSHRFVQVRSEDIDPKPRRIPLGLVNLELS